MWEAPPSPAPHAKSLAYNTTLGGYFSTLIHVSARGRGGADRLFYEKTANCGVYINYIWIMVENAHMWP